MLDFSAIDFETAKSYRGSPCSVNCARIGAIAEQDVRRRTNVLIVGATNASVLRPGTTVTGKTQKAFDRQVKSQDFEAMSGDDFEAWVDPFGGAASTPDQLPSLRSVDVLPPERVSTPIRRAGCWAASGNRSGLV